MTQPEALRLADWLLDWLRFNAEPSDLEAAFVGAAAELRRLYAMNQELLEALKLTDAMLRGANMDSVFVQKKVEAAIAKAEGKT